MLTYERARSAAHLVLSALLLLGFVSCSRQQVKDRMDPQDRLDLADRLRYEEKCVRAVAEYEKLLSEFPTPAVAEAARFNLALCHLELEQYDLARAEFEDFIDSYPKSEKVDNAIYMIAMTYLRAAPRPERDQSSTVSALNELLLLVREYPETDLRDEVDEAIADCRFKLAKKEYLAGELYFKMKDYKAAEVYFDSVLETYRDTPWAPRALLMKGKTYVGWKRFGDAEAAFRQVIDDFPESEVAEEAAGSLRELEHVRPAEGEAGSDS
jgi:outer membrane protein assembly factor BamD